MGHQKNRILITKKQYVMDTLHEFAELSLFRPETNYCVPPVADFSSKIIISGDLK